MRPKAPQNSDTHDLFRSRLDQIVDMSHPLAKLPPCYDHALAALIPETEKHLGTTINRIDVDRVMIPIDGAPL